MEYSTAAFCLVWAAMVVSVFVGREPVLQISMGDPAVVNNGNASRAGENNPTFPISADLPVPVRVCLRRYWMERSHTQLTVEAFNFHGVSSGKCPTINVCVRKSRSLLEVALI